MAGKRPRFEPGRETRRLVALRIDRPGRRAILSVLKKSIGICRSLHAFNHYAEWRAFLMELGFEVRLSPPVDRAALDAGIRVAPAEICLPVKAFLGQAAALAREVDVLFLPRIVCRRLGRDWFFGCPKALALPDVFRALFPQVTSTVELVIDEREKPEQRAFAELAAEMGRTRSWSRAWAQAVAARIQALAAVRKAESPLAGFGEEPAPLPAEAGRPRVGVVGHSYLVFDRLLGGNLLAHLTAAGARPVVAFPTPAELAALASRMKCPNWLYELELLASVAVLAAGPGIDGLLLASSFGCGTAAVTNGLIRRELVRGRIPILTLLLDEHTGEAGLRTRLESFVDLLVLARRQR